MVSRLYQAIHGYAPRLLRTAERLIDSGGSGQLTRGIGAVVEQSNNCVTRSTGISFGDYVSNLLNNIRSQNISGMNTLRLSVPKGSEEIINNAINARYLSELPEHERFTKVIERFWQADSPLKLFNIMETVPQNERASLVSQFNAAMKRFNLSGNELLKACTQHKIDMATTREELLAVQNSTPLQIFQEMYDAFEAKYSVLRKTFVV